MISAEDAYLFTHTLLREAAYELYLPSERARLHGLALAAMERVLSRGIGAYARELALHARAAGLAPGQSRARFLASESRYLRQWAELAWRQYDSAASLAAWTRLAQIERRGSRRQLQALVRALSILCLTGQIKRAFALANESLALARKARNVEAQAEIEHLLGTACYKSGDYAGTKRHSIRCEKHARKAGKGGLLALGRNMRGISVWQKGDLRAGLRLITQAQALFARARHGRGVYMARMNRGIIHSDLGDLDVAADLLVNCERRALRLRNERDLAAVLVNLGLVRRKQNRFADALDCYSRAEHLARTVGDKERIAAAQGNRGTILIAAGKLDAGVECIRQAQQIVEELGDRATLALLLTNEAQFHEKRGDFDTAIGLVQRGIELARQTGARHFEGAAFNSLADIYRRLNKLERSAECAQNAIRLFDSMGMRDAEEAVMARAHLAIALYALGHKEQGKKVARDAMSRRKGYATFAANSESETRELRARLEGLHRA